MPALGPSGVGRAGAHNAGSIGLEDFKGSRVWGFRVTGLRF